MYSDKVEVLRFETEPYRKHLTQNGDSPNKNGQLLYNNNNIHHHPKHVFYQNGYHNALVETETKSSSSNNTTAAVSSLHHHPPSDPIIASVLHTRQNPRPGRLLLENVNNRPQTMDRGTQASADTDTVITEAPSRSNSNEPTNTELYRYANINVANQKLLVNDGNNSSVDSLNSADSVKRDEESVIELAEFHQPMITKDDTDGHQNMSNGDGKFSDKPANGVVKDHPVDDNEETSCGMECLYFTMQCCECSIM